MIFFDTTKTGKRGRRSGLDRVSERLRQSLGGDAQEVVWHEGIRNPHTRKIVPVRPEDVFLTTELFSERERPGFTEFMAGPPCVTAGLFHDAIPLRHPHITWPQSVARHPGYMKLLARFNRVFAVSESSRADLLGFWKWQGIDQPPAVDVLTLGADFNGVPRVREHAGSAVGSQRNGNAVTPRLLCLGILEPRKNQTFLLEVCAELWSGGCTFELHIVGRVNPHFGEAVVARIKALRRRWPKLLHFHRAAPDDVVTRLYAGSRASVFPTIAEGCGLPLLESLWMGVPCVCSDLPVLRENADAGGCLAVPVNDREAWKRALRSVMLDDTVHSRLVAEAATRRLPTWGEAARQLRKLGV